MAWRYPLKLQFLFLLVFPFLFSCETDDFNSPEYYSEVGEDGGGMYSEVTITVKRNNGGLEAFEGGLFTVLGQPDKLYQKGEKFTDLKYLVKGNMGEPNSQLPLVNMIANGRDTLFIRKIRGHQGIDPAVEIYLYSFRLKEGGSFTDDSGKLKRIYDLVDKMASEYLE